MKNTKNKSFIIVVILFIIALAFMTVGFAAYNQLLNISGTATLKPDGKIYIKSVQVTSKSTTATVSPDPTFTETSITNFNLSFATDNNLSTQYYAVYEITIANESSYDFIYRYPNYSLTVTKDGRTYGNLLTVTTNGISNGETIPSGTDKVFTATITFSNPDIDTTGTYVVNGEFTPDYKEETVGSLTGAVDTSTIGDLTGNNQLAAFTVNVISTYTTPVTFTIETADTDKFIAVDSSGTQAPQFTITANNPGQNFTFYIKKDTEPHDYTSEIENVKILVVPTGESGVNCGKVKVRVDTNGPRDTVAPVISNVVADYSGSNYGITISWSATDNSGPTALDSYTIIPYKKNADNTYTAQTPETTSNLSYTFTGITEGDTYYYTVYGKDTTGNKATAGEINGATQNSGHASRSDDFTGQWEFTVTYSLSGDNINKRNGTTEPAYRFTNYTSQLYATANYYSVSINSISMGDNTLTADTDYTYTNNRNLTINQPITGNITVTAQSDGCLVEGTKILLANGQYKNIEEIKYTDLLKVYDHVNGGVTESYPIWIEKECMGTSYRKITFDDGTDLKIFNSHYVFDVDKKMYIDVANDEECKIGTRIYKWKNDKLEIATIEKIEDVNENVKFYNLVSTYYYNVIANDVITTDPTSSISNIYGFKENLIYSDNFNKISNGFKLPYLFVAKSIPYYLYKGLNLQNTLQLINNGNLDTEFLVDFINAHTVEPITKDGKRYFMMTTSLDEVNDENVAEYLYKEGDYYKLPRNGAKYFIDTFTNKKYKPGKKVKVENSMHFKAIN